MDDNIKMRLANALADSIQGAIDNGKISPDDIDWLNYKDEYWPRHAALEYNCTVGELACGNCGCVECGALHSPYCQMCGKPYFKATIDQLDDILGGLDQTLEYIDSFKSDVDIDVIKAEIGELKLRITGEYYKDT